MAILLETQLPKREDRVSRKREIRAGHKARLVTKWAVKMRAVSSWDAHKERSLALYLSVHSLTLNAARSNS